MQHFRCVLSLLAILVALSYNPSRCYGDNDGKNLPKGLFRCSLVVSSAADTGPNTLREAIACATSGQTITFAPSLANQTITLASTLEIPVGKNLTIDGGAAANLTISGNNAVRVFLLRSTSVNPTSLTLRNLRIINGFHTEFGAGIRSEHQGIMTIENCIFENNNAHRGGSAVFSHFEGRATIRNCRFENNVSIALNDERGSTVMLWGPHAHTIRNCEFINNRGINGAGINGLNAGLLIEDCNFTDNNTTAAFYDTGKPNPFLRGFGAAIYTDRASPATPTTLLGSIVIRRCRFEGNRARGEGGACYLYTDASDDVLIEDCYFNDNEVSALTGGGSGGSGGAIQHMNNERNRGFVLRNTTFSNNRAGVVAGAVRIDWADTEITNCTFFNNRALLTTTAAGGTAANGGALAFFNVGSSTVTITNCTFANNYAGWVGGAIAGPASVRIRNNIFFQNTAGNGGNTWNIRQQASEHFTDLGGNIQFPDKANNDPNNRNVSTTVTIANPLLNALANNGGFAPTMSLQAGSPAINAGVISGAPTTDQTGAARSGNPDAGAVEFGGLPLPPALPASIVTSGAPMFNCGMSEAAIAATGAARLTIAGSTYYIGTRQVTSINQNPIMAKFTGGVLDWCREDYETTGADGRGYGLFWSGTDLYAVFSTDGTQGTIAEDFRRFTGSGWLKTYTDASPGGGGGPKVAVILKIDRATGEGIAGQGTFITARTSTDRTNSLQVRDITVNSSGNLVVRADSWFSPRRTDRTAMTQTGTGNSPFDYTLILTPNLTTAVCASAVGWDNGTGVDCSGTVTIAPAPEIQVLTGTTNIPNNTGNVNFGNTLRGTPISRTFTIRNIGTADLTIGTLAALPIGFELVGAFPTGTLSAGNSATFEIKLAATALGSFSGSISFANNDSDENPFNFTIRGNVNAPSPTPPVAGGGAVSPAPIVAVSQPIATFSYNAGSSPVLSWQIRQGTPSGFRIERRVAGSNQPFRSIANLPGTDRSYTDGQTDPATLYEYRIVAMAAGQPDVVSATIQIPTPPTAPQRIADLILCGAGEVQIQLPAQGNRISFRWYRVANGGTAFQTNRSGEVAVVRADTTTTFFLATVFQNLESPRTAITVTVLPRPRAVISTTERIFCGAGLLRTEAEPETTYEWQRDAVAVGEGTELNVTQSGIYRLIARRNGCSVTSAPVAVTVHPIPVAEFIDEQPLLFCGRGTVTARFVPNAVYQWHNEQGELIGSGQVLTVERSGSYRLTVIANNCRSNTAQIDLTVQPIPARPTIIQSGDICEGGSIRLAAPEIANADYEWRGPNGFTARTSAIDIPYNLNMQGRYSLTISTNGCRSESASTDVRFAEPIRYRIVRIQAPTCRENADGFFQIESLSQQSLFYSLNGTDWTQHFHFGALAAGSYQVQIRSAEGCRKTATVVVPQAPAAIAQITANQTTINQFEQAQLQATGGISYEWSPAIGLSATNIANPIAKPTQTTTYTVRIRTAKGCEASASITIVVEPIDITIRPKQQVISPNGDGINDTWVVEHLDKYEGHLLRVMDRWGRTVFETSQYRNDWNAEGLPDGVYYYRLEVRNMPVISGAITVVR
ncbi:Ig-like domain-containing protein [Rhodoflexus sp.]